MFIGGSCSCTTSPSKSRLQLSALPMATSAPPKCTKLSSRTARSLRCSARKSPPPPPHCPLTAPRLHSLGTSPLPSELSCGANIMLLPFTSPDCCRMLTSFGCMHDDSDAAGKVQSVCSMECFGLVRSIASVGLPPLLDLASRTSPPCACRGHTGEQGSFRVHRRGRMTSPDAGSG